MLPTEYMKEIFQYIKKNNESLYPSLLVNRYWCKNVVTLLWACPFDLLNFDNVYKITSVYISFLEEHEKNQLKIFYDQKSIPKLIPYEKLLFNYLMMLEKFSIKNLERIVHTWIAKFCPNIKIKKCDNIMNVLEFQPEISQDLNITKLAIKYTQILIYTIKLLEKISKSCKKINYLIVKVPAFENNSEIKNSIMLIINAQERLKEFNLSGVDGWVDEIIKALQFQANSLISIKLECVNISESLLISLTKYKNLKNLVILNYSGHIILPVHNNFEFKNLKKLYIRKFLMNIKMQNLKKLTLEMLTQEMILSIIENCPNITHLTLKSYCPYPHNRIFKDLI
ncbi:22569_t:CDS:2 [Gigaspora margarita]|uniref:22569_t:CDS:1 n=1 Tax=Gigaspora margarita TaxID=4874 RepID=A0ABN7W275_GIGMA|nr:22569_t:CDS:2 [Gigaspora margarita]